MFDKYEVIYIKLFLTYSLLLLDDVHTYEDTTIWQYIYSYMLRRSEHWQDSWEMLKYRMKNTFRWCDIFAVLSSPLQLIKEGPALVASL